MANGDAPRIVEEHMGRMKAAPEPAVAVETA
jgi:hypothetical protein